MEEINLILAQRFEHNAKSIKPSFKKGIWAIYDRYRPSIIVYHEDDGYNEAVKQYIKV